MDDTVNDEAAAGRLMELPGFGITREEAEALLAEVRRDKYVRDPRICACGHPMTRHQEVDLRETGRGIRRTCNPVRMQCPCADPKPVLKASDTRPFLHKTKGRGAAHALSLGTMALVAKPGRTFEWLEGWPKCELAGWPEAECTADEGVKPYPVSATARRVTDKPEAVTFLLCQAHALAAANGLPS